MEKLTIEALDVDNYATWSIRMKMLLVHKELWDAVMPPAGTVEAQERA
jgi:hypothetical protein